MTPEPLLPDEKTEFNRSLSLLDSTLIVSGTMIGSGVFIVSADMARNLGSAGWLLALWVLTGVLTVAAALSYGELAGMMPKAGGQYVYIQRAYNRLTGFVYGWTVFAVIQTGTIAAVAVAFTKYSAVFMPALGPENVLVTLGSIKITLGSLYAIASVVLLTWLNSRGVQSGKLIQNVFTSAKLIALLGLIVVGIAVGLNSGLLTTNLRDAWDASTTSADGVTLPLTGLALVLAFGTSMVGSLFSADSWNNVTFIAGEIKDPRRNIPLALFLGTLIVTTIYFLANVSYLSLLPLKGSPTATDIIGRGIQFAEADRVATAAVSTLFGNIAVAFMAGLIMISTFGCNNGLILAGARLYYAMAKDGLFLKQASHLNENAVPARALWLQCIWASILCLSGKYGDLLDYCTFASLLFYIVTIGGLFRLRRKEPNAARPYRAFGYPLVPAIYMLAGLTICAILLYTKTFNTGMGLLIAGLGIPIYWLTTRSSN
ncbi:amino acid/polyamine/organocation transporter (APC superfamily) [Spirosoma oryzae]|uniref:Amino acid/polyamine/organocation transporter (APC superfamily) n=1 Tax=Spirosoma oryzae TaxID=1469603 RepID=A0A2T0S725_9BACT|nr:amino acid permease [Spirosoma oryzae]PRY29227.1 amino acid/polyamine/organocation transporter (APC superfamily) [Spirosoma oryzae]